VRALVVSGAYGRYNVVLMRVWVLLIALVACNAKKPVEVDHSLIRITKDANLRTDTIGGGAHTDLATFALVEAENTSKQGAYVTLAGDLVDASGTKVAELRPQSLWVPAGAVRNRCAIGRDRKPRPTAKGAQLFVRGARVDQPPPAHVEDVKSIPDDGDKLVLQGTLVNEAKRGGNIMVIATFYARDDRPMTRPFSVLWVEANGRLPIQFVGPPGSVRGQIFIGEFGY